MSAVLPLPTLRSRPTATGDGKRAKSWICPVMIRSVRMEPIFNLTVDATMRDPISGTPEHRANLCEVRSLATRFPLAK